MNKNYHESETKIAMINFSQRYIIFSRVHATLQPAMSVGRSVGPSVRPSVRVSFFGVTGGFCITAPAQMLGLAFIYRPCPPARDFSSRVHGLVCLYRVMLEFFSK